MHLAPTTDGARHTRMSLAEMDVTSDSSRSHRGSRSSSSPSHAPDTETKDSRANAHPQQKMLANIGPMEFVPAMKRRGETLKPTPSSKKSKCIVRFDPDLGGKGILVEYGISVYPSHVAPTGQDDPNKKWLDLTTPAMKPFHALDVASFRAQARAMPARTIPIALQKREKDWSPKGEFREQGELSKLYSTGMQYLAIPAQHFFTIFERFPCFERFWDLLLLPDVPVAWYDDFECKYADWNMDVVPAALKDETIFRRSYERLAIACFRRDFGREPDLSYAMWDTSSTPKKFSNHYHLPSEGFVNNEHQRCWKQQSLQPYIVQQAEHQNADALNMGHWVSVKGQEEKKTFRLFADKGVWSRNRAYRMHGNRKPDPRKPFLEAVPEEKGRIGERERLLRSMPTYCVKIDPKRPLLRWAAAGQDEKEGKDTQTEQKRDRTRKHQGKDEPDSDEDRRFVRALEGHLTPYTREGLPQPAFAKIEPKRDAGGHIVPNVWYVRLADGAYCLKDRRVHKGNHPFLTVNLRTCTGRIQCHDADCKALDSIRFECLPALEGASGEPDEGKESVADSEEPECEDPHWSAPPGRWASTSDVKAMATGADDRGGDELDKKHQTPTMQADGADGADEYVRRTVAEWVKALRRERDPVRTIERKGPAWLHAQLHSGATVDVYPRLYRLTEHKQDDDRSCFPVEKALPKEVSLRLFGPAAPLAEPCEFVANSAAFLHAVDEDQRARLFLSVFGDDVLFVTKEGVFYAWVGSHWDRDCKGEGTKTVACLQLAKMAIVYGRCQYDRILKQVHNLQQRLRREWQVPLQRHWTEPGDVAQAQHFLDDFVTAVGQEALVAQWRGYMDQKRGVDADADAEIKEDTPQDDDPGNKHYRQDTILDDPAFLHKNLFELLGYEVASNKKDHAKRSFKEEYDKLKKRLKKRLKQARKETESKEEDAWKQKRSHLETEYEQYTKQFSTYWKAAQDKAQRQRVHEPIDTTQTTVAEDAPEDLEPFLDHHTKKGRLHVLHALVKKWCDKAGYNGLLHTMQALQERQVDSVKWNQTPHKMPCPNGTIDWRTGELLRSNKLDYFSWTIPVPYAPELGYALVEHYVLAMHGGNPHKHQFLQTLKGMQLSGFLFAKFLVVYLGIHGDNGKTMFLTALKAAFGPFVVEVLSSMLFAQHKVPEESPSGPQPELKRLVGARLSETDEVPHRSKMNTAKAQKMIGGGSMIHRDMYQPDQKDTETNCYHEVSGNYSLQCDCTLEPLYKKLVFIDCEYEAKDEPSTDPEAKQFKKNPQLLELVKTTTYAQQMINWCVAGAKRFYQEGLRMPVAMWNRSNQHKHTMAHVVLEHGWNPMVGYFYEMMKCEAQVLPDFRADPDGPVDDRKLSEADCKAGYTLDWRKHIDLSAPDDGDVVRSFKGYVRELTAMRFEQRQPWLSHDTIRREFVRVATEKRLAVLTSRVETKTKTQTAVPVLEFVPLVKAKQRFLEAFPVFAADLTPGQAAPGQPTADAEGWITLVPKPPFLLTRVQSTAMQGTGRSRAS